MKKYSIWLLKAAICFIGTIVLILCVFAVPEIADGFVIEWPHLSHLKFSFYLVPYGSAIPFYFALWQAYKLLGYIQKKNAFSQLSVTALKTIKYCGVLISIFYALGMPTMFFIADADDAPGLILFTGVIILIPLVFSVFAGVLQGLFSEALQLKTENELTV